MPIFAARLDLRSEAASRRTGGRVPVNAPALPHCCRSPRETCPEVWAVSFLCRTAAADRAVDFVSRHRSLRTALRSGCSGRWITPHSAASSQFGRAGVVRKRARTLTTNAKSKRDGNYPHRPRCRWVAARPRRRKRGRRHFVARVRLDRSSDGHAADDEAAAAKICPNPAGLDAKRSDAARFGRRFGYSGTHS